ncbi:MAG: MMPL family transporter, partial [Balneolaceae bacterium]
KLLQLLRPLIRMNYRYPLIVLLVSVGFAILGASYAVKLKIDTDIANLLPKSNPTVHALEQLQETVGSETVMEVAVRSPDFNANIEFAERLMEESLQLYDERRGAFYFTRAEFRRETETLRDNALYLATTEELQEIISWLEDEIETAREEANPFFFDFSDEEEETQEDDRLERFQQAYDELIPSEYPVNQDSTLVILTLYPSGSKSNLGYLEDMFAAYDELIQDLDPAAVHPEMEVRFGGRLKRHLNELESIMNDVFSSFSLGISSVILLVMFYFFIKKYIHYRRGNREDQNHPFWSHLIRAPIPIAVIGLPLLISLCWTFGITYGVLGTLNTMTSVLFVILFGLGIDYGIHFYARYIELRSEGYSVEDSLLQTYERTGAAILVSGLTTASALFVLIIADFRGFSEFGFISGTGILFALICMLFVLPSMLVLVERMDWILMNKRSDSNGSVNSIRGYPFATTIVAVSLVISAIVLFRVGNLEFEYEFGNLEPVFEEYESFREFSRGVDESARRNPAYIIADSDEHVFEILEIIRERKESNPESMISEVVALQERFPPTTERAEEKLEYISEIRRLLSNPFLANQENEDLDLIRRASQTTEPLADEEIPDFLTNRFMTRDGEIGRFIIIYPDDGLSDGRRSIAFKNELADIQLSDGEEYHAGSTSIVAAEMLELMRSESPYMVTATFVLVFLFMYFSFRSFRWSVMAMIPLVVGFLFLFGIMLLFDLKFNFYNLVVLPAILGIGCDNGVHIAHRYRSEGKESVWNVLSSTGQHISIGSLTTMMGFAGLLFTNHPGLRSIGVMAVVGIGMTLLTALIFLPAMIQLLEERDWIKF